LIVLPYIAWNRLKNLISSVEYRQAMLEISCQITIAIKRINSKYLLKKVMGSAKLGEKYLVTAEL
jgi:hypothetical protein